MCECKNVYDLYPFLHPHPNIYDKNQHANITRCPFWRRLLNNEVWPNLEKDHIVVLRTFTLERSHPLESELHKSQTLQLPITLRHQKV